MRHRTCLFVIAALVMVASGSVGCADQSPRITSAWPQASAEATVAAPVGLSAWPLTGISKSARARATRVALAALFAPGPLSRELAGVGAADAVYEWGGSGSNTQVEALLQSTMPAAAGPVGASTPIAQAIAQQYRAVTGSLGSTGSPSAPKASGQAMAMTPASFPSAFGKGASGLPGGVYLVAPKANAAIPSAAAAGQHPGRLFFSASVESTQPIASVTVPFSAKAAVRWGYRAKTGTYERTVQGTLQRDALTKKTIAVRNVVVMWARSAEGGPASAPGDLSPVGSGQVSVFRGGVRLDGHWRASPDSPPRFTTDGGAPILLAPGSTWFEVIPLTANITLK